MKESKKSELPGFPWKGKFTTKDEINYYFSNPDGIQCLLCGQVYETLNGHLQIIHECSHEEYRARNPHSAQNVDWIAETYNFR